MKSIIFICSLLVFQTAFSQVEEKNKSLPPMEEPVILPPPPPVKIDKKEIIKPETVDFPSVVASFPGGKEDMMDFIKANLVYPQSAAENDDYGRVYVDFIVSSEGLISDVNVVRGITDALDREAKRLIRSMPNWIPAEDGNGNKVSSRCRLPIEFRLN